MSKRTLRNDYPTIKRSRARIAKASKQSDNGVDASTVHGPIRPTSSVVTPFDSASVVTVPAAPKMPGLFLKPGHTLSYAALFLFTAILYARPAEFYPSPLTASLALIVGLITLGLFVPTQLSLENTLTTPQREVKLVLLFGLAGLLSIPLAMSPPDAWNEFTGTFIRCIVIFVVLVNVVRTERRLKGLLFLALIAGLWLSFEAINDYRLGLMTVEGYRAGGIGGGIFGNSNDMALYLMTLIPITISLLLNHRGMFIRLILGVSALLMTTAMMLTYSRGAFIGLIVALGFLIWKLADQHKSTIFVVGFVVLITFLILAPGGYALRLASIFVPSLDPVGSADARRGELFRSLYVAIRHPLLGIGMGNYASQMSLRGIVTHNSYTQVAAEMGIAALAIFIMFIVTPMRKLGQIIRETVASRRHSNFHYLAVGLHAALLGYMVSSFFLSIAYNWYVYYLVGYAICLRRLYESETGKEVVVEKASREKHSKLFHSSLVTEHTGTISK